MHVPPPHLLSLSWVPSAPRSAPLPTRKLRDACWGNTALSPTLDRLQAECQHCSKVFPHLQNTPPCQAQPEALIRARDGSISQGQRELRSKLTQETSCSPGTGQAISGCSPGARVEAAAVKGWPTDRPLCPLVRMPLVHILVLSSARSGALCYNSGPEGDGPVLGTPHKNHARQKAISR